MIAGAAASDVLSWQVALLFFAGLISVRTLGLAAEAERWHTLVAVVTHAPPGTVLSHTDDGDARSIQITMGPGEPAEQRRAG